MKNKGGRPQDETYGIVLASDSEGKIHLPYKSTDPEERFNAEIGRMLWDGQLKRVIDKKAEGSYLDIERTGGTLGLLRTYMKWALSEGVPFIEPDFRAFKNAEFDRGMARSTVQARLATARGAYRALLTNTEFRDTLWREALSHGHTKIEAGRAFVKEYLERIQMRLDEKVDPRLPKVQDDDYLRLKPAEVMRLLAAPGTYSLLGLRETAHIALALAMGGRAAEIRLLKVKHLHSEYSPGVPAARVRGKFDKIRKAPYGNREVYMEIVRRYWHESGIDGSPGSDEYAIQAFEPDRITPKGTKHNSAMLEITLRKYPIDINGISTEVNPHDLRRTYAFSLYHEGMPVEEIAMNMGHSDKKGRPQPDTTWKYIGPKKGKERIPGYAYGEDEYRAAMEQEFRNTPRKIVETQKRRNWTDRILVRIEKEPAHWFWLDTLIENPDVKQRNAIRTSSRLLNSQGQIQLWNSRDGYRTVIASRPGYTVAELGVAGSYMNKKENVWMAARKIK